jgi:calcineurin-like phosphoesterase family protein
LYKGTAKDANEILSRLKGKKYLIQGNHEKYLDDPMFKQRAFEWVKDYYVLNYKGIDIILFHFPILQWHKSHRGSIHLYGHVHNSGVRYPDFEEKLEMLGKKAINVGVDVHDFYPVSIDQIIATAMANN